MANEYSKKEMYAKRDVRGLLALELDALGETEKAQEVRDSSRFTAALIRRVWVPGLDAIFDKATAETVDTADQEPDDVYPEAVEKPAENDNKISNIFDKVRKAINAGNAKKAKKALKELKEMGIKGSELDKLKKQVKGL